MFKRSKPARPAPIRTTADEWPAHDETWAQFMVRKDREGSIFQKVPFILSCLFVVAWLMALIVQAVVKASQ